MEKNRLDITIRDTNLIKEILKVKEEIGASSLIDVIKYLIDTYKGSRQNSNNNKVDTAGKDNTVAGNHIIQTAGRVDTNSRQIAGKMDTRVNHISSNFPTRLTSDEFLDDVEFDNMYDAMKTHLERGEYEKAWNTLKEYIGEKLLTTQQFERLLKLTEEVKNRLTYTGRGYKVQ